LINGPCGYPVFGELHGQDFVVQTVGMISFSGYPLGLFFHPSSFSLSRNLAFFVSALRGWLSFLLLSPRFHCLLPLSPFLAFRLFEGFLRVERHHIVPDQV